MSTYTIESLCEQGKPFAMAMLLRAIRSGEPFVTYGAIKTELEHQLKIPSIFTVQIGSVAGTLMNDILAEDAKAPLLNVMIARPNGIPSSGVAGYLADRYRDNTLRNWKSVPREEKISIVERERKKIFSYAHWEDIAEKLYGSIRSIQTQNLEGTEYDHAATGGFGGEAESEEHRRLKLWVAKNPEKIGVKPSPQVAEVEARLLSGDEVDVLFSSGTTFHTVEVKSRRSNDADFKRGIYQCVKYREVKRAEHAPFKVNVESILVTEAELSPELIERAQLLGVKWKRVKIS